MVLNRMALFGLLVEVAGIGACTSVRQVQPAVLSAENAPAVVWVTDTSNTITPIANPVIRRDTLRGTLNGGRVKIPMTQIRTLQARVPNHARTAALAITLAGVAVSTIYFAGISQAGGPASNGANCGQTPRGDIIQVC